MSKFGGISISGDTCRKIERGWCIVLFLVACSYIFFWAISSTTGWMLPEAFIWKSQIIRDGMSGSISTVIKRAFDLTVFEFAPRTTRPLASLFEIADTSLRSYLWKYITPHPSLSLTWLLVLFAAPWILYKILTLRGVSPFASVALIGIYLTQMGTLSSVVMLFRPGKPVALFFLTVCWYLCERVVQERFELKKYCLLLASLFISSLFDEYTLLTYMIAAMLLLQVLRRQPRLLVSFLMPGIVYLLIILYGMPWLTYTFYGHNVALTDYNSNFNLFSDLSRFLSFKFVLLLLWNVWVLMRESFYLYNPFDIPGLLGRSVVLMHLTMTTLLLAVLSYRFVRNLSTKGFTNTVCSNSSLLFILMCSIAAMLFHGVTIFMTSNVVWGPYYYASFFGVFVLLLVAELWKLGGMVRTTTYIWILTAMLASMVTFPAINTVYKQSHYYPSEPLKIRNYFMNTSNRFVFAESPFFSYQEIKYLAAIDWGKQTQPIEVPKHLLWVVIERTGYPDIDLDSSHNIATYYVSRNAVIPGATVK